MTQPKLFACLMVKDEQSNLGRCLKSIRNLCDEIIIVDTGSTDRTVKIAREYRAIIYPGAFNWRKPPIFDFSLHRNSGLQYCQELGADWVIVIDADEELKAIPESPNRFKRRLQRLPSYIHSLHVKCHERVNGEDGFSFWGVRFFRMTDEVHYEGIVHNSPYVQKDGKSAATNITIYHYGYSDPSVMEKKRIRTLTLLEKRLKEDPQDFDAMFYKVMTLFGQNKNDEAILCAEECMKLVDKEHKGDGSKVGFYGKLYATVGSAFLNQWHKTRDQLNADRAFQWLSKGLDLFPNDLDLNYLMTNLYWCANDPYGIREYGHRYMDSLRKYRQDEVGFNPKSFESPVDMDTMILTRRCLHSATKECEAKVLKLLEEAA